MSCCPPTSKKCARKCNKSRGNKSRDCDCDDCRGRSSSSDRGRDRDRGCDCANCAPKNCLPKDCAPPCPDRSDVSTDVAYVYNDEDGGTFADGAQLILPTTGPSTAGITVTAPDEEDDEPVAGSGTRLTVCNTGLYDFWYQVRGSLPVGEGGQAPLRIQLARGSDPDDATELDGTLYAGPGSNGEANQVVTGFGTVLLAKGDVLAMVNASGADLTLANDGAVAASLKLELTESRRDCCD